MNMNPPFVHAKSWRRTLAFLISLAAVGPGFAASEPGRPFFYDARNLQGWWAPAGEWRVAGAIALDSADPKAFAIQDGQGVLVNGTKGKTSNLTTEVEHGDVEAHIEFCVPQGSNSGIYFQGRYEVQVLDSWNVKELKFGDCGGLYASCSGEPKCYAGRPPSFNASKPPGQWQSFDVVFRAPRFDAQGKKIEHARFVKVTHNGRLIHENIEVTCPTCASAYNDEKPSGPLMLQGDHGPVAYRNLSLKPVRLP